MAKKDDKEISGSSFVPTITTEPVLKQLLQAGWRVTEIANAGILMFSNADEEQQRLFASIGTRIIDPEMNESARNITRDYVRLSEIVAGDRLEPGEKHEKIVAEAQEVLSKPTLTPMQRYQLDLFLTKFTGKSAGKKRRKTIIEAYCKDVRLNDDDRKRLDGFVVMLESLPEDKISGSWKASSKAG